jgi:hypothetical protein
MNTSTRSCSIPVKLKQRFSQVEHWPNQIEQSDYVAKLLSPASPSPGTIKLWAQNNNGH